MLKKLFAPKLAEDVKALNAQANDWAQSLGYEPELLKTGHWRIKGQTAGYKWRLTAGPTARNYFKQTEIKLGLSAAINPQVQGIICTRRLSTLMKQLCYGEATAGANTQTLDSLPFEMTAAATLREMQLSEGLWQEVACHSATTVSLQAYAQAFVEALPGGAEGVTLNTLLPWVVAIQQPGIVLRLGVPSVSLEHVKTVLRMQVGLIKPLSMILAPKDKTSHTLGKDTLMPPPSDSLPSR
jgi:hypothetical protein